jgi:hypothetical protein
MSDRHRPLGSSLARDIGQAKSRSDNDALRELVPRRNDVSSQLLALLRPTRDAHRDTLRGIGGVCNWC